MIMLKKFLPLFALSFVLNTANAGGIPVNDIMLNSQTVTNQIATAASWASQLSQMYNQYQQAVTMYRSVTGSRGMAALLNNPALQNKLPPQLASVAAQIKSGPSFKAIRDAMPKSDNPKINEIFDSIAIQRAGVTDAYNQASQRLTQIQQLQASIDLAADPAAKADLQNRMLSEIQAIQATNQLLTMLKGQQDADVQQAQQTAHQSILCGEFPTAHTNNENCK